MARVKLIQTRDDVPAEQYPLFDELAALRGRISGPSSVVLYSPGLARPWNQISEFLHGESIVEAQHAELAVCATAREFDCGYIWNAHVRSARAAGVSEAAIEAVATHQDVSGLPTQEAAVIRYVRQVLRDKRVDDATFDTLLKAHHARWVVELNAWIGRYAALAGILNCFDVSPAADAEVLPDAAPQMSSKPAVRPPLPAPRITPLTSRDLIAETDAHVFDAVAEGRGSVRGPFAMLLYSPVLCRRVLDLSAYFREDRFVPAATRELAVIATARERECPYVWAAHAPAARKEGVAGAVVELVRDRGDTSQLSPGEHDVVELVRQLLRTHRVDQELFDRLQSAFTTAGLVELVAVIGHYVFVTTLLNALEVSPAPGAEQLPLSQQVT